MARVDAIGYTVSSISGGTMATESAAGAEPNFGISTHRKGLGGRRPHRCFSFEGGLVEYARKLSGLFSADRPIK